MRKINSCFYMLIFVLMFTFSGVLFAQENASIELDDDYFGVRFVVEKLKYEGIRRHPIRKTNDAEQLFIEGLKALLSEQYDEAFDYMRKAIRKDSIYLDAHFILGGLYERELDLENMEREYRFYLKKTYTMRKWTEEYTHKDPMFDFIRQKFSYYDIPLEEPTYKDHNKKYWIIGGLFVLTIFGAGIIIAMKWGS